MEVQTRAGHAQNAQASVVLRAETLQGDIPWPPWPYEARDGDELGVATEFNMGTCHANMSPFRSSAHGPEDVVHSCCMPALWVSVRLLLLLVR